MTTQHRPDGLPMPMSAAGPVPYDDMPLAKETAITYVRSIIGVIRNFDPLANGPPDWDNQQIAQLIREQRFNELPAVLLPATIPDCCPRIECNLNIRPCMKERQGDPQLYVILKVYTRVEKALL